MSNSGILLGLSGLLFAVGCESPLLNHAAGLMRVPRVESASVAGASGPGDCPISFPKAAACGAWKWKKLPTLEEAGSAVLELKEDPAAPARLDPAYSVKVKLWMPSMGHGSSPPKLAVRAGDDERYLPRAYDIDELFFVMPGKWEIWIQLRRGDTVLDEAKLPIEL